MENPRAIFGILRLSLIPLTLGTLSCGTVVTDGTAQGPSGKTPISANDRVIAEHANKMVEEGRRIFRYDSFGSEAFWGDTLKLHQAIAGQRNGGVGPGLSPKAALAAGIKVDMDALPGALVEAIKAGKVDLEDPSTTLELLKLDSVVGIQGIFDAKKEKLTSIGLRCAVCHSTVDDAFSPGIGHRLDGWPNRDLDVGTVISLSPDDIEPRFR